MNTLTVMMDFLAVVAAIIGVYASLGVGAVVAEKCWRAFRR